MQFVRRIKQRNGQLVLRREEDDMAAAIEDAIEMEDGRTHRPLPKPMKKRRTWSKRTREFHSV
jgi:hypothetical protein